MDISKKDQKQTAGDNAVQTQIETQNNYNVTNHIYNIIQQTEDVAANATEEDRREELTIEGCNTSLWKRTLGLDDKNVEPLRESFLDARKNAEFLLGKIRKDFPNLTMHDITHVDSLWKVADVIIGDKYDINPLEGYVLGVAFLIHDAALSYDAVGGEDSLRETVQWKDAYADGPDSQEEEEFKKECDFKTIRAIHAQKAEGILEEAFYHDDGTGFYIIEDETIRTHYGKLIGEIAASHHWNIDDVELKFKNKKQINPMSWMPREWKINAQKLACILRCADAGHIDDGRAPDSIYRSLVMNGVSQQHWESQNHLCQVCEDDDDATKLRITSSHPFLKKDFDAWNVAFDAVRLFDEELKKSNDLLKRNTPNNSKDLSFPHKGISGAESKEALAKYIETEGWQPCSFGVHTSNVKALIESLGGSKLYGEENLLLVALRELIQNARDAIQARRTMDERHEEGRITICLREEEGRRWIEVEDDGIGMSLDCIKNHLLDFGSSYWKSRLAKDENPGLRSKGFKSIGKFGIGFYSVFMVAKSVVVITRRFKDGEDAKRIEFPEGLTLSPILSKDRLSTSVSTKVIFELKDDLDLFFSVKYYSDPISLQKALPIMVAGLDADVFYKNGTESRCIHTNIKSNAFDKMEWLKGVLIQTMTDDFVKKLSNRMEMLTDDMGNLVACIAVPDEEYGEKIIPSIETVFGLATSIDNIGVVKGFVGFVICKEADISRNDIFLDKQTSKILQDWLKEKYNDEYDRIVASDVLSKYYFRAMSYCGMSINEIEDNNMKVLYATYQLKNIEIGTIKGLKDIHMMMFSGISDFAGRYRVHEASFYNSYKNKKHNAVGLELLDETLRTIDKMPENSFEDIVLKYLQLMEAHPFTDGNGRAGRIWMNLMLKRLNGTMIDWRIIDKKDFYERMELFNEKKSLEPMCDFLRYYLSTEYEKEIISEAIYTL